MSEPATRFFDSHFHSTNIKKKSPEHFEELKNALQTGEITQCVDIGIDVDDIIERLPVLNELQISWYALGIYPSHSADKDWKEQCIALENLIQTTIKKDRVATSNAELSPRLVALGEIGIDRYRDFADVSVQEELFRTQIELANRSGLPIIVHNREADESVIRCLKSCKPQFGGILHCFSSSWETARQLLDLDMCISFAGNLTYKSSRELREVAAKIPGDRLLCETDSPYLSPEPYRGSVNWPGNVKLVYECLAQIRNTTIFQLCSDVETNLYRVLKVQ